MNVTRFILLMAITTATLAQSTHGIPAPEKFICKNGDTFTGAAVGKSTATLTIRVLRLTLKGKNITTHTASADGGLTLVHKDGTVFSGKFLKTAEGDFQLDEPLYPENFDLLRTDIATREPTVLPAEIPTEIKPSAHIYAGVGAAATASQIRKLLPNLVSVAIGANYDLSFIARKQSWYMPWVFAEAGFHYAANNPYLLLGGELVLGPEWRYILTDRQKIFFQLGAGMNYLRVRDNFIDQAHIGLHAQSKIGYGIRFNSWIVFCALSVMYMHDPLAPLTSVGGQFGVAKALGDKN